MRMGTVLKAEGHEHCAPSRKEMRMGTALKVGGLKGVPQEGQVLRKEEPQDF